MLFDNRRFNNPLQQYKTLNSAAGGLLPPTPKKCRCFKATFKQKTPCFLIIKTIKTIIEC